MRELIRLFQEKVLDLANYLLTGLIVAYYFEPGAMKGIQQEKMLSIALIAILSLYALPVVLGVLIWMRKPCRKRKK